MARFAAFACLFFVVVMLALPVVDGGDYAAGSDSISEGALVRFGWLQTAAFILLGVASVLLASVLRGMWTGLSGVAAPALIAIWGVAVALDGIFPVDEGARGETTSAQIHLIAALVAFVALLAAMWFASFAFRSDNTWAAWSTTSMIWSVVATAAFFIVAVAPPESSWGGYAQRGFTIIVVAWLAGVALVAAQVRRETASTSTSVPSR